MLKSGDVTDRKEIPGQEGLKGAFLLVCKYSYTYNKLQLLDELLVLKMF